MHHCYSTSVDLSCFHNVDVRRSRLTILKTDEMKFNVHLTLLGWLIRISVDYQVSLRNSFLKHS